MSALRSEAPLLAGRDFSGKAIPSGRGAAGPESEVIRGPDETCDSSRGAGAKEGDGRAETFGGSICIDAGDRRLDHRGNTAGERSGHQQAVT